MRHARADYDVFQDISAAKILAAEVLAGNGLEDKACELARQILAEKAPSPRIPYDEPVFLIRGQDAVGADAVRAWADLAEKQGADPEIIRIAREHANKMAAWATKKTPDLPSSF